MTDYQGPKNFLELSRWHANRMPFKTERLGQAFFNDFGFQTENSYYCEDAYDAWAMIVDSLCLKYPGFMDCST